MKQAMHNAIAHHIGQDAQTIPLLLSLLSPWPAPLVYILEDVIWYQISPWLVWDSCPGRVLSQLLGKVSSSPAQPRTAVHIGLQKFLENNCGRKL